MRYLPRPAALVLLSALLLTFSHPFAIGGFDLLADAPNGALAWFALVPWWLAVRNATPREAFRRTWWLANLYFLGTLYWVVAAMNGFGNLGFATSVVVLLALCAFLALFHAPAAWWCRRTELGGGLPAVWTLPIAWTGTEWLRATLLTGFPWSNLAYTQWRFPALIQTADLFGVYGICALLMLVNVALAEFIARGPFARRLLVTAAALSCLSLLYGISPRPRGAAGPVVALVQGNISQEAKHDRSKDKEIIAVYQNELVLAEEAGVDLVVWPEAAIPGGVHVRTTILTERHLAQPNRAWLLTGVASYWHEEKILFMQNTAMLVEPGRRVVSRYHKSHLVPFGEYVPFQRILFFVQKMTKAAGYFVPGRDFTPLSFPGGRFGVLICYEDLFPEVARAEANRGADFLVSITNDAWYGRTSAPHQHLALTVFRAIETRRTVARAAQTGVTAMVAPSGRVTARSRIFEGPLALIGRVELPTKTRTLYMCLGDAFAAFCLGAAAASRSSIRHQRKTDSQLL